MNEIQLQTIHSNQVYIPSDNDWKFMMNWGLSAIKSGMLPESIKTPEAAAIIILKGRELGLSFMTAIAHIHVIKGKPSMSAELMQAMARKNLPGLKIVIIESTSEKATVKFLRPEGGSEWFPLTFSMEDAKKAELLSNPSWKKYPRAMLWSRAIAAGLRTICPEALMGISYTPEELGAHVNEQGDVIETTSRAVSQEESKKELAKVIAPVEAPPVEIQPEWRNILLSQLKQKRMSYNLTPEEVITTCMLLCEKAPGMLEKDDFTKVFLHLDQTFGNANSPWEVDGDPRIVK